jgi:hypothetical protein
MSAIAPFSQRLLFGGPIGDKFDDEMKQGDRLEMGDVGGVYARNISKRRNAITSRASTMDMRQRFQHTISYSCMHQHLQNARREIDEGAYICGN